MKKKIQKAICLLILSVFLCLSLNAQTTEFAYQGSLNDNAQTANGSYDFEFALFDALSGGSQAGPTLTRTNVSVSNGTFSVKLDFGNQFRGADLWLEIRVRQTPAPALKGDNLGGAYTTLSPRQEVSSSPYAVKSLDADNAATATNATNATQLGGFPASQYVQTNDPRLSDARTPMPGSGNYIQNTTVQQAADFNISGTGKAANFDASADYRIGGSRVLSISGTNNLFVGKDAGTNTTADQNVFVGTKAGESNTSGDDNSFFGFQAGEDNTTGSNNSFFGHRAGEKNTTGSSNNIFGTGAGLNQTTGANNSFFGTNAGFGLTTGQGNSFFGNSTGFGTTTGIFNTFIGRLSGGTNTTGDNNTVLGHFADVGTANLNNATAIGFRAQAATSNSLVLGSIDGVNGANTTVNVGIGTNAPTERLHVSDNGGQILFGGGGCGAGVMVIGFATTISGCSNYSMTGTSASTFINAPDSSGSIYFRVGNTTRVRIYSDGRFRVNTLGSAGSTSVCRNTNNELSTCSSSIRYKSNIEKFNPGLDLIKKLRPVSFNWTKGGILDVGLVAEEVEKVEPLLTTTNKDGQVEGVKYDRIGVVLVNAVKEQQAQIQRQKEKGKRQNLEIESLQKRVKKQDSIIKDQEAELKKQRAEIDALKELVCKDNPAAVICKP